MFLLPCWVNDLEKLATDTADLVRRIP